MEKCSPFKKKPSSLSKRTVRIPIFVRTQSNSVPFKSIRLTTVYSFGISGDHGIMPVKKIDWQTSEFCGMNGLTLLTRTSFPSQIQVSSINEAVSSNSTTFGFGKDTSDLLAISDKSNKQDCSASDICTCVSIFNSACQLSFSFFSCVVCTNTLSSSI